MLIEHIYKYIYNVTDSAKELKKHLSSVTNIDLFNSDIADEYIKVLAYVLARNSTPSRDSVKELKTYLSTMTNIEISDDEFVAEDIRAFINALVSNTTITNINISGNYNGADAEGAKELAGYLSSNTTITKINHQKNDAENAKALAGALASNITITNINVYGKNIGNRCQSVSWRSYQQHHHQYRCDQY